MCLVNIDSSCQKLKDGQYLCRESVVRATETNVNVPALNSDSSCQKLKDGQYLCRESVVRATETNVNVPGEQ